MPAATCLLARDFGNLLEAKMTLIEYRNVPLFLVPVFSIIPVYLSLAERLEPLSTASAIYKSHVADLYQQSIATLT